MNLHAAVLDHSKKRGKFTPLTLREGKLPLAEGIVEVGGRQFHIRRHFEHATDEVPLPRGGTAIITEAAHGLIVLAENPDILIVIRLVNVSSSHTPYLYLNEISASTAEPGREINFGYLIFRVRPNDLHIRDYDPCEPFSSFAYNAKGEDRPYGKDLDLTRAVMDIFAIIARETYQKSQLVNTYPYPEEQDRFLTAGFKEEKRAGDLVWVRDV